MTDVTRLSDQELDTILQKAVGEYLPSFEIMKWRTGERIREAVVEAHETAKKVLLRDIDVPQEDLAKCIINLYHAYKRLDRAYRERPEKPIYIKTCEETHLDGATHAQILQELAGRLRDESVT